MGRIGTVPGLQKFVNRTEQLRRTCSFGQAGIRPGITSAFRNLRAFRA